jgi:hypothetical protein
MGERTPRPSSKNVRIPDEGPLVGLLGTGLRGLGFLSDRSRRYSGCENRQRGDVLAGVMACQ